MSCKSVVKLSVKKYKSGYMLQRVPSFVVNRRNFEVVSILISVTSKESFPDTHILLGGKKPKDLAKKEIESFQMVGILCQNQINTT